MVFEHIGHQYSRTRTVMLSSEFSNSPPVTFCSSPFICPNLLPPARLVLDETDKKRKTAEKRAGESLVREICNFPKSLMDPHATGVLDIERCCEPGQAQRIISEAHAKLASVEAGQTKFGAPVVIPSFVPFRPKQFQMPATSVNLFFFNILCTENVALTHHGKVSVFPVSVFTSTKAAKDEVGGFPCLAVHVAHFKTLSWTVYARSRVLPVCNESIMGHVTYRCDFSPNDDKPLVALSGFDAYKTVGQKRGGGFILIPAHFIDVMKYFFIKPHDFAVRDIGDVLRNAYATTHPEFAAKLVDRYRPIWLGEERRVTVAYMITDPDKQHNYSMTRVRALDGKVSFAGSGRKWMLSRAPDPVVKYHSLSFAYGVQCWTEQVMMFNSAYTFFTGHHLASVYHQAGLFALDTTAGPVLNRDDCIAKGILSDVHLPRISNAARRRRNQCRRESQDPNFARNFFGAENIVRF